MSDHVRRIMLMLSRAYPDYVTKQEVPAWAQTIQLYERLLADVPAEVLEAACLQHIATSKWFPKVAELRDGARAITAPPRPTAMEAWGEVQLAIRRVGFYGAPHFDDPITARTVQAMGWRDLCMSENPVADRARFIQAYDSMAQRQHEQSMLLPQVAELAQRLRDPQRQPAIPAPDYTELVQRER